MVSDTMDNDSSGSNRYILPHCFHAPGSLHVQASPSSFVGGAGLEVIKRFSGNSFFVAIFDNKSVAIAIPWKLSGDTDSQCQ